VPGPRDDNKNIITILGTRTGVAEAKAILEKRVTELASIEELTIEVPFVYHKNFTARRAEMINEISDQCGGVQISFPKQSQEGDQSETVTVKGPGKCVREAMGLIKERVEDLEAQITDELDIDREHHRSIIGSGGSQVKEIQADFNVNIRFPLANDPDPATQNIIQISGRKEKVELARARLLSLVPVIFEYELEQCFHRDLVGKKGETVRELMKQYDINISIPKPTAEQEEVPDLVTLRGKQEGIDGCCAAIDNLKLTWEDQAADRLAREYTETIEVHPMFHSKIIGQKGARIKALQEEHSGANGKVQVNFPRAESKNDEAINIVGYSENVKSMREAIEQIVADLESHVSQDVLIGKKVHPRLIGTRGSGIRKLMKEFGVDIRIGKGADPDRVTVVGPSSKVEECIDHMLNLEEEILQEMAERDEDEVYRPEKRTPFQGDGRQKSSKQGGKGFSVQNAPWDASCDGDFPTLGDGKSNGGSKSAWGPKH
jgi:transcription antitermination factor NusA-like protein